GAAPAVLVAFSTDTSLLVWTILLYVGVQQLENNLIVPVMQRRIVDLPPVILLFSFVALGLLFGLPGILVAAPLTISIYILIREFYVGDLLDEREVLVAGNAVEEGVLPPAPSTDADMKLPPVNREENSGGPTQAAPGTSAEKPGRPPRIAATTD